jgi:site-specific DNA-methyltransferase (adenine-specific)
MKYKIIKGDVQDVLSMFDPDYFSASLADPPYHLTNKSSGKTGFMNEKWDGGNVAFRKETWEAVKQVLKPGAFMMNFGGTRTYHRLVCGIEDAGMEIRDALVWMYADSRPPSLDISKAIDKRSGAVREVIGKYKPPEMQSGWNLKNAKDERTVNTFASSRNNLDITAPSSDEAQLFDGYGTALKPSCELISLSMKPMEGDFVDNALNVGISGLNIKAGRILVNGDKDGAGRWPKNVLLDEGASDIIGDAFKGVNRFFYCNKVSTQERKEGLPSSVVNDHNTLKPIMLTKYLAGLMLPPKQSGVTRRILCPFCGSGSEMIGAVLAGWDEVIGIENGGGDDEVANHYIEIAENRLKYWSDKFEAEKEDLFTWAGMNLEENDEGNNI